MLQLCCSHIPHRSRPWSWPREWFPGLISDLPVITRSCLALVTISEPDLSSASCLDLGPVPSLCTCSLTWTCGHVLVNVDVPGQPCMGTVGVSLSWWSPCFCGPFYMIGSWFPVSCSSLKIPNLATFSVSFSSSAIFVLTCGDQNITWKSQKNPWKSGIWFLCCFHNHAYHRVCLTTC